MLFETGSLADPAVQMSLFLAQDQEQHAVEALAEAVRFVSHRRRPLLRALEVRRMPSSEVLCSNREDTKQTNKQTNKIRARDRGRDQTGMGKERPRLPEAAGLRAPC